MSKIIDLNARRQEKRKKQDEEAYKQAIARILERAKKLDW